jgi:maleylacetoacetate isomerase/maleylpyruvate isomerase
MQSFLFLRSAHQPVPNHFSTHRNALEHAMTDPDRFELFGFWRTSATYRVRVAFNLKGIAPRERFVNIDAAEQRGEAFLKINPMGAIPVLIDHGPGQSAMPLTQSLAILEFIEETYPAPPLLPADSHGRARVRSLAAMLAADTHPLFTPRVRKYLSANAGFDDAAWRAWQIHWFTTGLQAFEQRLLAESETGIYCHGNTVTIADICLASIFVVMRVFKIDVADIPNCQRIMAACEALDAFAKAAPMRQFGAPTM